MPGQPDIVRILPFIIRLFPQLAKAPVPFRFFISLLGTEPTSNEQLEEELARRPKYKRPKQKQFNDAIYVIKLEEAIRCVEEKIDSKVLGRLGLISMARQLLNPVTGDSPIGDAIIKCLRENVLRQDTPRVLVQRRGYHRPATGHGKGR